MKINYLSGFNIELTSHNQNLTAEKFAFIQKIEQLNSKIEYLNKVLSESDKARQESFISARAALVDLGHDLSKQLIDIHKRENQEIKEQSEKTINRTTEKFTNEFERLVSMISVLSKDIEQSKGAVDIIKQSLLSPSGAGQLAEITLENILKSSGLRPATDFIMQYSLTTNDNVKLRPDSMIFLPGGNLMVVDAKASKFLVESGDSSNLTKTMNTHLKSLTSKEYAENIFTSFTNRQQEFNNIITLMFLPTEHAVEKIITADPNFMQRAWAANIFPVGPAGLMNMLSFAKFQITDYLRTENHKLIVVEVRKLLLSVAMVAEYSQKLGNNVQSMVTNYDKFAASFNRSFLNKAKNMQKLGIDIGNKTIPSTLERYQLVATKSELIEAEPVELPTLEEA